MSSLTDPTAAGSADAPPNTAELEGLEARLDSDERQEMPEGELEQQEAPKIPFPPINLRHRAYGRYRSGGSGYQLELRVDVDGYRPLNRVSGDFFSSSGGTTSYFGSFIVHSPKITKTVTQVVIEGLGTYTWSAGAPIVRVTIPLTAIFSPPGTATVQFFTLAHSPGATYTCAYVSSYYRTVQWEQDSVAGTVPFVQYNTGSLPQPPGSPARVLTVPKAYGEAGIEMQVAGAPNVVPVAAAGPDARWDDSELHGAMQSQFSLWKNIPQWKVWTLVASRYASDGVRGIMFDYNDAYQRQGCAVFYDAIKGTDAASQRAQLRTYVHELGHAFNLLHSWQKNLASPPAPLGPNGGLGDLSWMNYAWKFQPPPPAPGGEPAYWAGFPFQFTNNELIHLRHGYYRNVVMGANKFGTGAAEVDLVAYDEPVQDESGFSIDMRCKSGYEFGEPVVIELKLATTDLRGRETHGHLHPADGFVSIAIQRPDGRVVQFRPMLEHCVDEEARVRLDGAKPAIYKSAYIGFGKDGHYFQQPGQYKIRALYVANDGSRIVSPVCGLKVRSPLTKADEQIAELMMGEQQGQLFTLLGSDSPFLKEGNEALDEVIDKHGKHPLAVYARMVKGVNAERDFKHLSPEKELSVRPADTKQSIDQLTNVADLSAQGKGVDNITLNMVMRRLARARAKQGEIEQANDVLDRMVQIFTAKKLNQHVLDRIRRQAEIAKAALPSANKKKK